MRALACVIALSAGAGLLAQEPVRIASLPLPRPIATEGKVTAVIFISTRCPISNDYVARIKALYREYSAKGVQFAFVNSNFNEPESEIEKHARETELPFPVWRDAGAAVADRLGAQSTPEAYVIDQSGVVRYHGAIDDARNEARVTKPALREALDAVLDQRVVATPETKAFGCTIKRERKASS